MATPNRVYSTSASDILLTPAQTSTILQIKVATLAKWRWEGKGPKFKKIGGRVRYAMKAIEEFIEECERVSTSDTGS